MVPRFEAHVAENQSLIQESSQEVSSTLKRARSEVSSTALAALENNKKCFPRTFYHLSATHLPIDIVECISYLTGFRGVEALSKVNRKWREILVSRVHKTFLQQTLSLSTCVHIAHVAKHSKQKPLRWKACQKLDKIKTFKHFSPIFTYAAILHFRLKPSDIWTANNSLSWLIAFMPRLQTLNLSDCNEKLHTDNIVAQITGLNELKRLNLSNLSLSAENLRPLNASSFSNLQTLVLSGVSDEGVSHLAQLQKLKKLHFSEESYLSDVALSKLSHLPIEKLHIDKNEGVLTHFSGFTQLRSLNLGTSSVSQETFHQLQGCSKLQAFFIDDNFTGNVSDTCLVYFHFPHLKALTLQGCQSLTDEGMGFLAGLTALEELDLRGCCNLTDDVLDSLKSLKNLHLLNLTGLGQLTDEGIRKLASSSFELQTLYLKGCSYLTDSGLEPLKRFTALSDLDLGNCDQISYVGLVALEGLTRLSVWLF